MDGLRWTSSARKRAISRPDSSSNLFPSFLNENSPRNRTRARAQSLFYPTLPSPSSPTSSSSYFTSPDTPVSKGDRGLDAFAVLNNVDLIPSFDERTVRAVVSPVKAALDMQKVASSARDLDARPPAKQRRRSRSPVKNVFGDGPSSTAGVPSKAADSLETPVTPAPTYNGGAPMERSTSRRTLSRTHAQADITFGVSPSVATEVIRGRERLRGSGNVHQVEKTVVENLTLVGEDDEVLESDLVGGGTIRFRAPRERGRPFTGFAAWPVTPSKIRDEIMEEEDVMMTPTPGRFNGAVEYPIDSDIESPIRPRLSRVDLVPPLKRKRQPSECQVEVEEG